MTTFKTLLKELTDLDTALYDAYWVSSTAEGKDQIRGAEDLVDEVIAILDKADLESDNPEITGLAKALNDVTKDLCDLQKQIDKIVHNVQAVTKVVDGITLALKVAGKITSVL